MKTVQVHSIIETTLTTEGGWMKSFTFYQSYIQLKTKLAIIQYRVQCSMASVCFFSYWCTGALYSLLKKLHQEVTHFSNCWANFRQIECTGFYLLTNWLTYLYGRRQSPRPSVMPDQREGIMRAAGFGSAGIYASQLIRTLLPD